MSPDTRQLLRLSDELDTLIARLPIGGDEFLAAHKLNRFIERELSLAGITRALPSSAEVG